MVVSKETIKARELFSRRLSTLLNEHNMNQNELAKILNVSESTVGKWVLGKSMPRTMGIIQTIADSFGVGKSYLLEEVPQKETPAPTYYLDPETAEIAEQLHKRKDMRMLFHAAKSSTPEDVKMVTDMLERFKNS